jgi:hypothetical protein
MHKRLAAFQKNEPSTPKLYFMDFSFSNRRNLQPAEPQQSKPTDAKYVSAHKAHFKTWRSNRMYRSVRYTQQPLFGISKIFSPSNLF